MDPEQSHVGTAGPGPGVGHVLSPSHPVKLGHVHNHLQVFQGAGGCGGQRKDLEGAYIFMRLWNRAACSWLMHLGLSYERSKCYLLSHYTVRSLNSNLAFCPYLIQTWFSDQVRTGPPLLYQLSLYHIPPGRMPSLGQFWGQWLPAAWKVSSGKQLMYVQQSLWKSLGSHPTAAAGVSQAVVHSYLPSEWGKSSPWSLESVSSKRPARNCEQRSQRKYVESARVPTAIRFKYEINHLQIR